MKTLRSLAPIAIGIASAIAIGCVAPPTSDARTSAEPSELVFRDVHAALLHGCGTLDCHGNIARNLRIFGATGLRASPSDIPGQGTSTEEEVHRSFRSVVGLEPERMADVVTGARSNDALTLIRKARGLEGHVAGAVFRPGSNGDRCLIAWLAGDDDGDACAIAAEE